MTHYAGDDTTLTFTVTNPATPQGNLTGTPVVTAHLSGGGQIGVDEAAWLGDPAPTRTLAVPIASLPAGLWSLRLRIVSGPDVFLGNVAIDGVASGDVPAYDPGGPTEIDGGTP